MKLALAVCSLFVALALADGKAVAKLSLADECNQELCKLPDCRCSSTSIPGGLAPQNTPQFVTVTFEDNINVRNIITYREILYNRVNTNRCPAGATFFVSHEYTDYRFVNELYNNNFEIGLNSMSKRTPRDFWVNATYNELKEEIVDQRPQIAHFANIPAESIQGVRLPFLQMTGNTSFQVMADHGLLYDYSWPTNEFMNPGLWPYTLDYESKQDCIIPPCPTASVPKSWVLPMVSWADLTGIPCGMVANCFHVPSWNDTDGWYQFILGNFQRHYQGNRAPFGIHVNEWFLSSNPDIMEAFNKFLNYINSLNDVFMVNSVDVIEWVKNPISVTQYRQQPCKTRSSMNCQEFSCGPVPSEHNEIDYWMNACAACPRVYPWVGNPYGL